MEFGGCLEILPLCAHLFICRGRRQRDEDDTQQRRQGACPRHAAPPKIHCKQTEVKHINDLFEHAFEEEKVQNKIYDID